MRNGKPVAIQKLYVNPSNFFLRKQFLGFHFGTVVGSTHRCSVDLTSVTEHVTDDYGEVVRVVSFFLY